MVWSVFKFRKSWMKLCWWVQTNLLLCWYKIKYDALTTWNYPWPLLIKGIIVACFSAIGYRAYKNLKTIRSNMVLSSQLFLNETMEWLEFQWAIQNAHKNRQGQVRLRKETQSIYTYPIPDCMCQQHWLVLFPVL